jgi:hypothetical protein
MSEEILRELALQVRNWGKWGPEDELGTLNYITPAMIAQACQLVTAGKVFALGIPLQRHGPQSGTRQRFNPIHTMFRDGGDQPRNAAEVAEMQGYGGSDDWIVMPLQCVTQWDSLAHVFYDGEMYNGFDAALVTSSGAAFARYPCRGDADQSLRHEVNRARAIGCRAVVRASPACKHLIHSQPMPHPGT